MNQRMLAITLVAVLPLAACGGGTKKDQSLSSAAYKAQLAMLDRQDAKAHAYVDGLPHAHSVAEMKSGLSSFAAAEQKLGARVAGLKPPANATSANTALAKAFADSAADMKRVQTAIATAKTPRQALTTIGKLGPQMKGGPELDAALGRLKRLGYTTGD